MCAAKKISIKKKLNIQNSKKWIFLMFDLSWGEGRSPPPYPNIEYVTVAIVCIFIEAIQLVRHLERGRE